MDSNQCPVCHKRILTPSGHIRCLCEIHLKCITLSHIEHEYLLCKSCEWFCGNCIITVFPFNNIEEDREFMASICNVDKLGLTDDDLIFHPFESNDNDHRSPLCEIDPDLYFYNSINLNDIIHETTFNEADQIKSGRTDGALSMCHLNIRSIRKSLGYFEVYLKALDLNFSLIGLSETWLQDNTCDLYDLDDYNFFETHRTTKTGAVLACLPMRKSSSVNVQIYVTWMTIWNVSPLTLKIKVSTWIRIWLCL